MSGDLVHVHIRLSPPAAAAWQTAADKAGASITGLAEAIGRHGLGQVTAIGRGHQIARTAREIDQQRKRRPGPRSRKQQP